MRGPTDRLIAFTKNEIHPLTILHQETFSDRRGGRVSTPKMLLTVNVMSFFATTLKRKYREIITLFFALLQRSFRFSCTCLNCATLTIAGLRYPGRLIFLASSAAFALISSMCFLSLASISSDVTTLSFFSKKNKFTILDLCTCWYKQQNLAWYHQNLLQNNTNLQLQFKKEFSYPRGGHRHEYLHMILLALC